MTETFTGALQKKDVLSIVVPCYNEDEASLIFYEEICIVANKMNQHVELELIFVDDGSKDDTLAVIETLHERDIRVHYISFSRNFGKEAAIYAGLVKSKGDFVAVMDVDLQDPPELLEEMYHILKTKAYDCVATRRVTRQGEPAIRSFFARLFYRMMRYISRVDLVDGARDYRLMTRQVTDAILSLKEYNRFSKGIFGWVGFKTQWLEFENRERSAGETKWSFWKLLLYSFDGIIAFSTMPLAISSIVGIILFSLSLLWIIMIIIRTLLYGDDVQGYPSLVSIMMFIGGVQLFCLGIVGQYIAKLYLEIKQRPIYIIKKEK